MVFDLWPVQVVLKWASAALPMLPRAAATPPPSPPASDRLPPPPASSDAAVVQEHCVSERRAKRQCCEALPTGVVRWPVQAVQQQAAQRLFDDLLPSRSRSAPFATFDPGDGTAGGSASSSVAAIAGAIDRWHSCTENFHSAPLLQRTACALINSITSPTVPCSRPLSFALTDAVGLPRSPQRACADVRRRARDLQALEAILTTQLSRHYGYDVRFFVMEIGARVIEKQVPIHQDPLPKHDGRISAWERLAFAVFTLDGEAIIRSGAARSVPDEPWSVVYDTCIAPESDFRVAANVAYAFVGAKCCCVHESTGSGRRRILVVRGYTTRTS